MTLRYSQQARIFSLPEKRQSDHKKPLGQNCFAKKTQCRVKNHIALSEQIHLKIDTPR
jgi:hypothetical protein